MNMTETYTADRWLSEHGISFDWSANGYHADPDGWEHQRFTLLLSDGTRTLTIPWRQGLGIDSDPTPESTLPAVRSDVTYGDMTWSEFADEFGHDEYDAPLSAYRTWEACVDMGRQLREAFPAAAADFLRIEEVDADTDE